MKTNLFFSNIRRLGNLYLDFVFFRFEMEPLLFTCVDENHNLYFCHCYKMLQEQKWFVVPVTMNELKSLINRDIDIVTLLKGKSEIINITLDTQGAEQCEWKDANTLNVADLPAQGTFLRCDKEQALMYVDKIQNQSLSECVVEQQLVINYRIEVAEYLNIMKYISSLINSSDITNEFEEKETDGSYILETNVQIGSHNDNAGNNYEYNENTEIYFEAA